MGVGEGDAFQNFVKREVRPRAQRQIRRSHVDSVGAIQDRNLQLFQRPGRHQQFGGVFHGAKPRDMISVRR